MAYHLGDYVESITTGAVFEVIGIGATYRLRCVLQGHSPASASVGSYLSKSENSIVPTTFNGLSNVHDVLPAPTQPVYVGMDLAADEKLSEEADPFGLVKQRQELRKLLGE